MAPCKRWTSANTKQGVFSCPGPSDRVSIPSMASHVHTWERQREREKEKMWVEEKSSEGSRGGYQSPAAFDDTTKKKRLGKCYSASVLWLRWLCKLLFANVCSTLTSRTRLWLTCESACVSEWVSRRENKRSVGGWVRERENGGRPGNKRKQKWSRPSLA